MHAHHEFKPSPRQDALASLVVFLIALPLSLGIALASGAPPMSALVAGILGGAVVGFLSGAPLVVTGPAAGLSAMILQYIQTYGLTALFQITVLAGGIQLVLAALRSASLIQKLPKSVVEGVLSAIGAVIVLGQIFIIMGQSIPGNPIKNILALPSAVNQLFDFSTGLIPLHALIIGLLTLMTIVSWNKFATNLKWIPAALPGVIVATIASLAFDIPRMAVGSIGPYVSNAMTLVSDSAFWSMMPQFLIPAFGLAVVASAESLLTARSVDVLTSKKHIPITTRLDRELMAQGVGNILSGAFGGLPMTGVMVRSAANIDAGATSRWSTVLHSVWIAVFVVSAPDLLNTIPLSALAAVLILTGIKLMNFSHMTQALKEHPMKAWVWPATAVAVIATDLLKGLGIGLAAALIQHFFIEKNLQKRASHRS